MGEVVSDEGFVWLEAEVWRLKRWRGGGRYRELDCECERECDGRVLVCCCAVVLFVITCDPDGCLSCSNEERLSSASSCIAGGSGAPLTTPIHTRSFRGEVSS